MVDEVAIEKEAPTGDVPRVLNIVRYISKEGLTDPDSGVWGVHDINEYLSAYIDAGYEIVGTHYIGEAPEGYGMIYVLAR